MLTFTEMFLQVMNLASCHFNNAPLYPTKMLVGAMKGDIK